jgi:hypothetical protein
MFKNRKVHKIYKLSTLQIRYQDNMTRDSSVGIATGYGLDDQEEPEFESR